MTTTAVSLVFCGMLEGSATSATIWFAQGGGPNVFSYFAQSNMAGKVIIVLLGVFSMIAWTVMVGKFLDLKRLRDLNLRYERRLSEKKRILSLDPDDPGFGRGPYAYLVGEAITAFYRYGADGVNEDARRATLRIGHVENALHRAVAEQVNYYEAKMVLLGSIVTGAPFLGLLGTVWGVMDAFGSVTAQTAATLQSLSPGVSGALLTTVAGLLVAIPSVFGYNFLLTLSKLMTTEVENFASTLADRIELESQ